MKLCSIDYECFNVGLINFFICDGYKKVLNFDNVRNWVLWYKCYVDLFCYIFLLFVNFFFFVDLIMIVVNFDLLYDFDFNNLSWKGVVEGVEVS